MIKNDKTISSSLIQKLQDCTTDAGLDLVFNDLQKNFKGTEVIIRFDREERHINPLRPKSKKLEFNLSKIRQDNRQYNTLVEIVEGIKNNSKDLVDFLFNFLGEMDRLIYAIRHSQIISDKTHYEIIFPVFWDRNLKVPTVDNQTETGIKSFVTNVKIGEIKIFEFFHNMDSSVSNFKTKMNLEQFLKTELKKKIEESIAEQLSFAISDDLSIDNKDSFFIELSADYRAFNNSNYAVRNLNKILEGMNSIEKRMFLDWVKERFEIN